MDLQSLIKTGKEPKPPKILVHATHGVGKSSLGASAPSPIFIQTEDGLAEIDTAKFPVCQDFNEFMNYMMLLYKEEHEYKTLIVDSLDWLERLVHKQVCKDMEINDISDAGYGAGYSHALSMFERVINGLSKLRDDKNMSIVILAHSHVKPYANPIGEDYDRHTIKCRDKVSDMFNEFVDMIGYLHMKTTTTTEQKGFAEQTKAVGGSERILSCQPHAAFESKNRYGITSDIAIPAVNGFGKIIEAIKKSRGESNV